MQEKSKKSNFLPLFLFVTTIFFLCVSINYYSEAKTYRKLLEQNLEKTEQLEKELEEKKEDSILTEDEQIQMREEIEEKIKNNLTEELTEEQMNEIIGNIDEELLKKENIQTMEEMWGKMREILEE